MNVRELVNVIKFKTDTGSMKSAETAVNRIKKMMDRITPVTVKANTGTVAKQVDNLNKKLSVLSQPKTLRIKVDDSAVNRTIAKINGIQKKTVAPNMGKGMPSMVAPNMGKGMPSMIGGLKAVFAMAGGFAVANEVKQTADAMMGLSSRIKIVTKSNEERLKVEKELYSISQRNRASMEGVGDLYYKIAMASENYGMSQKDLLRVVDITTKALSVGGADTAQQKSTILQLSQAIASGVLQGDELRSLRENAPELMKMIAKNLNVDPAGLKEMGAKGLLTSDKLLNAILASGQAIDEQFKQVTPTIDQALTVIGNKFSMLIMDIQNRTGIFGTIAGFIIDSVELVGKAIDWVKQEFSTATPEMMGMVEDFKNLWQSLQPLIHAVGTIFVNWIVPALITFSRVASAVLGTVAQLLQPIADLLGKIANIIATISGGLPGIIKGFNNLIANAERGAMNDYRKYTNTNNQTNNFTIAKPAEAGLLLAESNQFFASLHP